MSTKIGCWTAQIGPPLSIPKQDIRMEDHQMRPTDSSLASDAGAQCARSAGATLNRPTAKRTRTQSGSELPRRQHLPKRKGHSQRRRPRPRTPYRVSGERCCECQGLLQFHQLLHWCSIERCCSIGAATFRIHWALNHWASFLKLLSCSEPLEDDATHLAFFSCFGHSGAE